MTVGPPAVRMIKASKTGLAEYVLHSRIEMDTAQG